MGAHNNYKIKLKNMNFLLYKGAKYFIYFKYVEKRFSIN